MEDVLFNYLESFMIESNWDYDNTAKQARAIFTTICFVGNIDADTCKCEKMLSDLYWRSAMEEIMEYDDFVTFMIELII